MANADRPSGFFPYGRVEQSVEMVAGARIFPGDFVHLEADGKVDPAVAGEDIYGLALSYVDADLGTVLISIGDNQLYIGQASSTEINVQDDIGNLCNILATAGNTTYNQSRMEVDSSTIGTGGGGQVVLMAVIARPDNAFGTNVDVLVKINEHQIIGEDDFAGI